MINNWVNNTMRICIAGTCDGLAFGTRIRAAVADPAVAEGAFPAMIQQTPVEI